MQCFSIQERLCRIKDGRAGFSFCCNENCVNDKLVCQRLCHQKEGKCKLYIGVKLLMMHFDHMVAKQCRHTMIKYTTFILMR